MSSFARRTIKTTAAAAGIAALGVGFAGQAFAADTPELPTLPDVDAFGALTDADLPDVLGSLPEAPTADLAALPDAFSFDAASFVTDGVDASALSDVSAVELPSVPDDAALPELPALSEAGLPGLPELPALPVDLPELPELPAAPSADVLSSITDAAPDVTDLGAPQFDAASLAGDILAG